MPSRANKPARSRRAPPPKRASKTAAPSTASITPTKKKPGRKSAKERNPHLIGGWFTPHDLKRIAKAAKMGMTEQQLCDLFEMSRETWDKLTDSEPLIASAYKKGQALGVEYVTGKLFALIRKGNVAAIIFYLKTRAGWREKIDFEGKVQYDVRAEFARISQTIPDEVKGVISRLSPSKVNELFDGLAKPGLPAIDDAGRVKH